MDLLNLRGHRLRIFLHGIVKKLITLPNPTDGIVTPHITDDSGKLLTYFLIGYAGLARHFIIGQITEMDQQRQHVIPILKCHEIIVESIHIHPDGAAADQFRHNFRHTIKIQTDIPHQTFRSRSLRPIGAKTLIMNSFHN